MADVEEKVEYLFYKGYTYEEIVGLLSVGYGIQRSLSTLKRKLKDMNLSRKNVNFDVNLVRQAIESLKNLYRRSKFLRCLSLDLAYS